MVFYKLIQQGPAIYIPVLFSMLAVTLVAYGTFPLGFAKVRKKIITRRKYNLLCYGINFLIMILFIIINGDSSGSPYMLWTCVFSLIGENNLRKKGLLEEKSAFLRFSKISNKLKGEDDIKEQLKADSTFLEEQKITADVQKRFNEREQSYKKQALGGKQRGIYVFLIVAFLVSGYVGMNYFSALSAMNNQEFIKSKQFFDNLLVSDQLFPDKYAYVEAGVLLERGEYVEAYNAFKKITEVPVPITIMESLKAEIYSTGQSKYREGKRTEARLLFSEILDYKRSEDYLLLIRCHSSTALRMEFNSNYDKLIDLLGFEDTNEIIMKHEITAKRFLKGRWENDTHYFELKEKAEGGYHAWYNLPSKDVEGHFYISDGVYSVGQTELEAQKYYQFTIIDTDTISVYCYKDGNTHRLYRQ